MRTCGGGSMRWLPPIHSNGTGFEGTMVIQRTNGPTHWLALVLNRLGTRGDQLAAPLLLQFKS